MKSLIYTKPTPLNAASQTKTKHQAQTQAHPHFTQSKSLVRQPAPASRLATILIITFSFTLIISSFIFTIASGLISPLGHLTIFVLLITLVLTSQSLFTLFWMLYSWENPGLIHRNRSPSTYHPPHLSFTALIPARHEHRVIVDTIRAVYQINYPDHLKEIIVLCRYDDTDTILAAQTAISQLPSSANSHVRLEIFHSSPVNKPHALNLGLQLASHQVITIFDAEDQPHTNIYHIINTLMLTENVDVVQSGIQLMNFRSHWFSLINVLEYFFWFKSGLHFFTRVCGVTPLGGNTVFFKKSWLRHIGGWDETQLTEDADIGFRLALAGARTRIVYDEAHVTQEETPSTISEFVKQRTRWDQGFLQVLAKGDWQKLPTFRQRLTALYVLLAPEIQTLFFVYAPIGIWIALHYQLPVIVSIFSFLPLYLFIIQLMVYLIGTYEFTRAYRLPFSWLLIPQLLLTFIPYYFLLTISSIRAIYRAIKGQTAWEKTLHLNAHRQTSKFMIQPQPITLP